MKKFAFILIAALALAGCQTGAKNSVTPMSSSSGAGNANNNAGIKDHHEVQPVQVKGTPIISDACRAGNIQMCKNFADQMYSKGDFTSAIVAYNIACQAIDIPSCVKMAFMFEKGEGVEKNLDNAGDIHQKACFHGYKPSCKDAKRLGYTW